MRRTLGALGALLLWFASWWGGAGTAVAQEAAVYYPPPPIALGAPAGVALNGRSIYWFDDGASVSPEQVLARADELPWRLRRRDNQTGVHGGALWILFDATTPAGDPWYLEVAASINDRVELFYRGADGKLVRQEAGTNLPVSHWSVPGRLPTFRLAPNSAQPVRYLLRIEDERADFLAPLMLMHEDLLREHREREQFVFGAYFGLMGLVAIAALANGLIFRDRAFLLFALYIVLFGTGQLARIGLGAQHVWRDWQVWNERLLALWPGAATAAVLWLVKIVTDPARLSRALDLAVWALIAALLAATALHVAIDTRISLTLVLSLTGLSLVAILSMVVWGWLSGHERHLALVAIAFVPAVVMALFPLARGLGLAPTNIVTRFGLFFGTLLELPLLYYALNSRLMLRREAELRASALSRTDPLTGLPHRRALVERLDTSLAQARAQKQHCALLGVRITNLEAIAEEFGREAADKALVVAASQLRRITVGYDMAARVGERDFAVLLEAPVTREIATSRAQQVVASGLRQIEALPAATLRFHVTVGTLPRTQFDGAASLQWVLDALDLITPDTRKAIRSLDTIQ